MKKEQLFDAVGEIDDGILDRYRKMDLRLARKHAKKRNLVRVIAVAACFAILISVCVPAGMLIAQLGKQPPAVDPGEITPPTETGSELSTSREDGTHEDGTVDSRPDHPNNPGEDTTEDPTITPPQADRLIRVFGESELQKMHEMIACEDEQELQQYLSSVMGGGLQSRQDLIDFITLIDNVPFAPLVSGELVQITRVIQEDSHQLFIEISAENGDSVSYDYLWSEFTSARVDSLLENLGSDNLLQASFTSADGLLHIHAETNTPPKFSNSDYCIQWWGELDGAFLEITYRTQNPEAIDAVEMLGSINMNTGIVTLPSVPPEPAEPKYAWENTQFGAYLEQPEFHAYVTYDTPSPQLDQYVKDVEVDSENYTDPNAVKERTITVEGVEYALTYQHSSTQDTVLQATHYYKGQTDDGRKYEARFDQETDACVRFWLEGGFLDASIYKENDEELSLHTVMRGYLQNMVSDFDAYESGISTVYQGREWSGFTRMMVVEHSGYRSCDTLYISYNSETRMIEGFMLAYVGSMRYLDSIPKELLQSVKDTFDGFTPEPKRIYTTFKGLVITEDGRLAMTYHVEVMNDLSGYNYSVHDAAELLIYLTEPIK